MKTLVVCLLVTFPMLLNGQYDPVEEQVEQENIPKTFVGVSNGINNFNGILGVFAETKIINRLSTFGGIGIGSWGYKASAGFRYYKHYPVKIYYSLFFSVAGGKEDFKISLGTKIPDADDTRIVKMNLEKAYNLNIALGYQFKLAQRLRFNFELGYSIPINNNPYEILTPGIVLTEESESTMQFLSPGGLILGIGFSVGF